MLRLTMSVLELPPTDDVALVRRDRGFVLVFSAATRYRLALLNCAVLRTKGGVTKPVVVGKCRLDLLVLMCITVNGRRGVV